MPNVDGLPGVRLTPEEAEKLLPGARVRIVGAAGTLVWDGGAAFLLGKICTLKEKVAGSAGFWKLEEAPTWGNYRDLNFNPAWLELVTDRDMKAKENNTALQNFVDSISKVLVEAGIPEDRVPSSTFFTTKVLNDWLDKPKVEEWITRYIKEETPPAPLDLSKFSVPKKKREIATPQE